MWEMKKVKQSRKGSKTYSNWMASWREGNKTRNVHLGSTRKMDGEVARRRRWATVRKEIENRACTGIKALGFEGCTSNVIETVRSGTVRSAARIWRPWTGGRRRSSPHRPGRLWENSGRRRVDGGSTMSGAFRGLL